MGAGEGIDNRLRRVEGQVSGIRRMREEGRYCIEVLDQVTAARAGLEAVALLILEEHVDGLRLPSDQGR
jgi:DNA-binding FrmR family transcriptional regulator